VEFTARQNFIRVSPQKLRLVADVARGKTAQKAIDSLRFNDKRMAKTVVSLLESAVNNATQNRGVDVDKLVVKRIFVDKGPTMKRFMTRARGGASTILKRTSKLTVVLEEKN